MWGRGHEEGGGRESMKTKGDRSNGRRWRVTIKGAGVAVEFREYKYMNIHM